MTFKNLPKELATFSEFGKQTLTFDLVAGGVNVPMFVNEFWTAKQRAGHSLHEISYRACFKPQLPKFFIERLSQKGDIVYDPFSGRGTTAIEAALLGRQVCACDVNPLSAILTKGRLEVPAMDAIKKRLESLSLDDDADYPEDLLAFYSPATVTKLANLRTYFHERQASGEQDAVDRWLQTVATNRLTGHSPGFFSVYTMPPNQAVTAKRQREINAKRQQTPPDRDVEGILIKKSQSLMKDLTVEEATRLRQEAARCQLLTRSCDDTPEIADSSISLVVTSPPFLAAVNYQHDNWLRCWFNHIDAQSIAIWKLNKPSAWQAQMAKVFIELHRVVKPGGHVAFEVGELDHGRIRLEELVVPAAIAAGFHPELVLINDQVFTKTSNCWGIDNQTKGTNTNRVVLLRKLS